jgi:hypothetical protein
MLSVYSNGITSEGYDLEDCIKRTHFALSKYFSSGIKYNGDVIPYKTFFKPHGQINTLSTLGYSKLPGIHRRPILHILHDTFDSIVTANSWRVCMTDSGNSFGRGVYVKGISLNVWTPCPLHETYRIIDKRKEQSASISASPEVANDGVNDEDMECDFCAFDHIEAICLVERDFYWYRFFSYKGQISKCMHIYEVREGENNVIDKASASDAVIISSITNLVGTDASAIEMPTSETSIERISRLAKDIVNRHRVKKKGPCHICRSTTTAAKFWHTSPISNPWPGIAADMVLCQKCYQIFYRAVRRGVAPIFIDAHTRPPDIVNIPT